MKVRFKGKSGEYKIKKSHFCTNAFVIEDKISGRDGVDFITCNVDFLEFSDESFGFDELIRFLETPNDENIIVVDEFFEKDLEKDFNLQEEQTVQEGLNENFSKKELREEKRKPSFVLGDNFSRIFCKNLFIKHTREFEKNESLELSDLQKFEFFKNLEESEQELSFVKIEVLNYEHCDSISFNLELFPSGVSYKYGIYENILRIILTGKMQNTELFKFLRSFVYKNKGGVLGEKIFTLTLNQNPFYRLKIKFIA